MNNYLDLNYISIEEAAKMAGVNYATVLAAIKRGELTAIDGIGSGKRTTREWLNAWVGSKVINPGAAGLAEQGE